MNFSRPCSRRRSSIRSRRDKQTVGHHYRPTKIVAPDSKAHKLHHIYSDTLIQDFIIKSCLLKFSSQKSSLLSSRPTALRTGGWDLNSWQTNKTKSSHLMVPSWLVTSHGTYFFHPLTGYSLIISRLAKAWWCQFWSAFLLLLFVVRLRPIICYSTDSTVYSHDEDGTWHEPCIIAFDMILLYYSSSIIRLSYIIVKNVGAGMSV